MISTMIGSRLETVTPKIVQLPCGSNDCTAMLFGPKRMITRACSVSMSATDTTTCASTGAWRTGRNTR
jgi:hypothetical protein